GLRRHGRPGELLQRAGLVRGGPAARDRARDLRCGHRAHARVARARRAVLVGAGERRRPAARERGEAMTIVLGYDESPGAVRALEVAIDLAERLGERLVVVYGAEPPGREGEEMRSHAAALE